MDHSDWNTVALVVVALLNVYSARLMRQSKSTIDQSAKTIDLLEKNTNSIKDALVASTAKASKLEGRAEQRDETEAAKGSSEPIKVDIVKIPKA